MTTLELNAEIYRNLGYLANDESYLQRALTMLKELVGQKKLDAQTAKPETIKKIKVTETTLPTDKFVGFFGKDRDEDKKMIEEYLAEKYGLAE